MSTRRKLLLDGLCVTAVPAALMAFPTVGCMRGVRNSTPPPLPADNRITGDGSLKAHAARHGLFAGAAVQVNLLETDAVYRIPNQTLTLVFEND